MTNNTAMKIQVKVGEAIEKYMTTKGISEQEITPKEVFAILNKVLTVAEVDVLLADAGIAVTQGSGKDGAVIKADKVKALVKEMFAVKNAEEKKGEANVTQQQNNPFATLTEEQKTALRDLFDAKIEEAVIRTRDAVSKQYEARIAELEAALASAQSAKGETPAAEPKQSTKEENQMNQETQIDVTENVSTIFKTLNEEADKLAVEMEQAYKRGDVETGRKLMKQITKLRSQARSINSKFAGVNLYQKFGINASDALRKSAELTRKHGHNFVDELINLSNELLGAGFKVVETALDGTKRIIATSTDAARKVGHFGVETVATAQDGLADLIDPRI